MLDRDSLGVDGLLCGMLVTNAKDKKGVQMTLRL